MRLVLDTTVLIDHLRGDARARDLIADAVRNGDEIWSVTVVRTEVLAGMRSREEARTLSLLEELNWLDVTIEVADRAGDLARRYLKSHRGVDTTDYILAAACEILQARLFTSNVKHFPMIKGIKSAY